MHQVLLPMRAQQCTLAFNQLYGHLVVLWWLVHIFCVLLWCSAVLWPMVCPTVLLAEPSWPCSSWQQYAIYMAMRIAAQQQPKKALAARMRCFVGWGLNRSKKEKSCSSCC